jgi:hypothetical protein
MMKRLTCLFGAAVFALLTIGCGDADVGEECDEPGMSDECVDGAICTNEEGGAVCRVQCTEQDDCASGEACNGISGTDKKSCQPDKK